MKTAKQVFKETWIAHFGHSCKLDEQLRIVLEHGYIFDAMESYANLYKSCDIISDEL